MALSRKPVLAAVLAAALLLSGAAAQVASAKHPPVPIVAAGARSAVPDSYVVRLRDTEAVREDGVKARAESLVKKHGGTLGEVWAKALRGFGVTMSEEQARDYASDPEVEYMEQTQRRGVATPEPAMAPAGSQTPASWALDRIDQHLRPLDNRYSYDESAGEGVRIYVIHTGIRASHPDLAGRVGQGANFIFDGRGTDDCNGGGTMAAGAAAGTVHGVAKRAQVVPVRVFDCRGLTFTDSILSGFEWVIENAVRPGVVTFSLNDLCFDGSGNEIPCTPEGRQGMIFAQEAAFAAGIAVVTNAGDHQIDTCARSSGAAPNAIYVGSTTISDTKAPTSNFGPCLTLWAPGENVPVITHTGTAVLSNTTIAASIVTGAVALFMSKPEFADATPADIRDELTHHRSTFDVLSGIGNSPNRLLHTGPEGLFTVGDSLALTPTGDGRLQLTGADKNGKLVNARQSSPNSTSWEPWTTSVTGDWFTTGAGTNSDGRTAIGAIATSGDLWVRQQDAPNANRWSRWSSLGRPGDQAATRVAMAHNNSNRLQLFVTTDTGQLYTNAQQSAGSDRWGVWRVLQLTNLKLRSIAVSNLPDSRIALFGLDDTGQIWYARQTSPTDNNWTTFVRLPGFNVTSLAAARNGAGTIELIGVDAGGQAWRRVQTNETTWTDWTTVPLKTLRRVAAETNGNNRIHLVGTDNFGNIWQSLSSGGAFPAWTQIPGQLRP